MWDYIAEAGDRTKLQELISGLSSEKRQQIFAADEQLPLAPLVSASGRSQIDYSLHLLHLLQRCVVAQIEESCDLTGNVVSIRINLDRPATHPLLITMASGVGEQFVDVSSDLVEIGLRMPGGFDAEWHQLMSVSIVWGAHLF